MRYSLGLPTDRVWAPGEFITGDAIAAMRGAWSGRTVEATGGTYRARGNTMLPTPDGPTVSTSVSCPSG